MNEWMYKRSQELIKDTPKWRWISTKNMPPCSPFKMIIMMKKKWERQRIQSTRRMITHNLFNVQSKCKSPPHRAQRALIFAFAKRFVKINENLCYTFTRMSCGHTERDRKLSLMSYLLVTKRFFTSTTYSMAILCGNKQKPPPPLLLLHRLPLLLLQPLPPLLLLSLDCFCLFTQA